LHEELLAEEAAFMLDDPVFLGLDARLRLAKDDVTGAVAQTDRALDLTRGNQRDVETAVFLQALLGQRAEVALVEGRGALAHELADELLAIEIEPERLFPVAAVWLSVVLFDLGRLDEWPLARLDLDVAQPWLAAAVAISHGMLGDAADRLAAMRARTPEADVRLRAAAQLKADGQLVEADVQLQKALAFYRSVGATRYIREAQALLAATA
jgi:hypothetical protein